MRDEKNVNGIVHGVNGIVSWGFQCQFIVMSKKVNGIVDGIGLHGV